MPFFKRYKNRIIYLKNKVCVYCVGFKKTGNIQSVRNTYFACGNV